MYFLDIFVSSWLWGMTFASAHIIVLIIILALLFRFFIHQRLLYSCLISIAISLFSFVMYAGLVWLLVYGYGYEQPDLIEIQQVTPLEPLRACVTLGLVYGVFQSLFFICMYLRTLHKAIPYLLVILISNSIAAFANYCIIRMAMSHYL